MITTKKYELVVLLQPQLSKDEHEKTVNEVLKLLADNGGKIIATDDIGMLTLAHDITKLKLKQAYFLSYHIELPSDKVQALKPIFAITKGIIRFSFFLMTAHNAFVSYADINKTWELQKDAKGKNITVKKGFFEDKDMMVNVNWKSVNLLRHYTTRFGNIKPRAFMGNRVKDQKKVRQAIIRARELGVIAYTH